jgi:hypothetical protein
VETAREAIAAFSRTLLHRVSAALARDRRKSSLSARGGQSRPENIVAKSASRSRRCLFCGNPADSREHFWPQWVLQRLQRPRVSGVLWERPGESHRRIGVDPAITVRSVCRSCNHGWLASLEGNARPVIGALINDLELGLDPEHQAVIAQWTVKMSMILEAIRGTGRDSFFYDEADRDAFKRGQLIPKGTSVWLGRYAGKMYSYVGSMDGGHAGEGRAQAFASTFVVGRFAFQVLSVRSSPERRGLDQVQLLQNGGQWAETTAQIWPLAAPTVRWPPSSSFKDVGTTSIFNWERRWAREA